jgi:hypothetical protein
MNTDENIYLSSFNNSAWSAQTVLGGGDVTGAEQ